MEIGIPSISVALSEISSSFGTIFDDSISFAEQTSTVMMLAPDLNLTSMG